MPVGPELPPHLQKRKRSDVQDDQVVSPPSKLRAVTPPESKQRRVLGPSLPPADLSERPTTSINSDDDGSSSSSSDDEYGPSLPTASGSAAYAHEASEREAAERMASVKSQESTKPQRADWMLVPPTDSDWTSRIDPTKLKNRKFNSGKGSKAPTEKTGISAIWTETPEEKRQRLEDEMLGRKDASVNGRSKKTAVPQDREGDATSKKMKEYNEKHRGKSLMDQHQEGTPKEKDDDPSARAFDREKDMALGGRLGHGQKKELLRKAGDFGSRFERGSYL